MPIIRRKRQPAGIQFFGGLEQKKDESSDEDSFLKICKALNQTSSEESEEEIVEAPKKKAVQKKNAKKIIIQIQCFIKL